MGFNYQIIITVVITILRIGGKSISVVTRMIPKISRLVIKHNEWTSHLVVIVPKLCKVGNTLKGSLDSIPSPTPSVKIQIMSLLEMSRQKIDGNCQQTFCFQKFVDITQQCYTVVCIKVRTASFPRFWKNHP